MTRRIENLKGEVTLKLQTTQQTLNQAVGDARSEPEDRIAFKVVGWVLALGAVLGVLVYQM